MTPLGIFRKKEKKEPTEEKQALKKETTAQPAEKTLLGSLCKDDQELYEVMARTILLNPETVVKEGANFYLEKAQNYEKDGNRIGARTAYQTAGEISLYEGKLPLVQKFFKKAADVDPEYPNRKIFEFFGKKENAERALAVAKEFYTRTEKHAETQKT